MNSLGPSSLLRVLYVEDHADTAEVFTKALETRGYRVQVAPDCQTALTLARQSRFDLLLCDMILPDGDGCDLLSRLREQAGPQDVRAIALSAHGMVDAVARAQAAGYDAYVLKPVEMEELFGIIEAVWRSNRVHFSSTQPLVAVGGRTT